MNDFAGRASGIGSLADPVRRSLYDFVASSREPVSREQAAAACGVPHHTAKFHLDRLVRQGLLETSARRLSPRQGRGGGRPSKLYARSGAEVAVSLPERRYDLAGALLAEAVEASTRDGAPVLDALREVAADRGRAVAREVMAEPSVDVARPSPRAAACAALAAHGYEPVVEGAEVTLSNCPFHALAAEHTELVCGMNQALLSGLAQGLGAPAASARLEPSPGRCCVVLSLPD
jgi:predicted ArsR family transcriptional regulator